MILAGKLCSPHQTLNHWWGTWRKVCWMALTCTENCYSISINAGLYIRDFLYSIHLSLKLKITHISCLDCLYSDGQKYSNLQRKDFNFVFWHRIWSIKRVYTLVAHTSPHCWGKCCGDFAVTQCVHLGSVCSTWFGCVLNACVFRVTPSRGAG